MDAGDLQRLRARHVAQQPARLQRTYKTQHNSVAASQATPTFPPAEEEEKVEGKEEEEEEEGDE